MKKIDKQQLLLWLRRCAMVVLVVLCSYCCSPRRGFLSTLPLVPLACLISSLIYYAPKYTVLLAALCSFSFTLADGNGMGFAALIALFCALSALLGTLAAKRLAMFFSTKRIFSLLLALLLLCPAPLLQSFLFSTPQNVLAKQREFETYVSQTYPDQEFIGVRAYYNVRNDSYEALLRFSGGKDVVLEETLRMKDGQISEDGFFSRFCQRGLEQQQSEYVTLIRSRYPDQRLWLDCSKSTLSFQDASSFDGTFGSVPQWLKDSAALELGFQFSIQDAKTFLSYAKEYLDHLNEADFPYAQIRFFGGDQGTYLYTLTVTPDTDSEQLAPLLRNCKINMNIPSLSLEYSYLF